MEEKKVKEAGVVQGEPVAYGQAIFADTPGAEAIDGKKDKMLELSE